MERTFVPDPSPWVPISDPRTLKVLGKFVEELGECVEAAIQRVHRSTDDHTDALQSEIADVLCNIELVDEHLCLNWPRFHGKAETGSAMIHLIASLGGCIAATARCIIQGVDECEPSTGTPNREWLFEAITHVRRYCVAAISNYDLDPDAIDARMTFKRGHLTRWHQMEIVA